MASAWAPRYRICKTRPRNRAQSVQAPNLKGELCQVELLPVVLPEDVPQHPVLCLE
jgi:hypothetical protein